MNEAGNELSTRSPQAAGGTVRIMMSSEMRSRYSEAQMAGCQRMFIVGAVINTFISVTMLVIGVLSIGKCPIQPMIPIYLIVAGCIGIIAKIPMIVTDILKNAINTANCIAIGIIRLIEGAWMIMGSFWIFSIYRPNFEPSSGPFCDQTCYWWAFGILTFIYTLICIYICILCGFQTVAIYKARSRKNQIRQNQIRQTENP